MSPTISIIVPVLNRPQALLPFMDALRMTTPLREYEVVFVTDESDKATAKVIQELVCGLDVSRLAAEDGSTFPQKINAAVAITDSPYVLCCGDDVVFKPGWFEAAMRHTDVGVIGTNDLTPRTRLKDHATAQIIRRDYINDPGAAWQEPGRVFHEGYHHNYADNELCALAAYRGEWTFADDCVIEHRHPVWGTAQWDGTYERGQENVFNDKMLYRKRRRMWIRTFRRR